MGIIIDYIMLKVILFQFHLLYLLYNYVCEFKKSWIDDAKYGLSPSSLWIDFYKSSIPKFL